jgi:hypothetical protein
MQFPGIYIYNSKTEIQFKDLFEYFIINETIIAYRKEIRNRLLLIEKEDFFLLGHVNPALQKRLLDLSDNFEVLNHDCSQIVGDFHWGFLVFINKNTSDIKIINDVYGIYPLYRTQLNDTFIFSNDFDGLIKITKTVNLDQHGIYDYFLFNYTLTSRTLIKEISQMEGGSIIATDFKKISIERYFELGSKITQKKENVSIEDLKCILNKHVTSDIDPALPIMFPLTGGFDSKVVLSILLSIKKTFSSFTFGTRNSADHQAAEAIADDFDFPHTFWETSGDHNHELSDHIEKFTRCYPNAPMFDTLLFYQMIKSKLPFSNLITGQMGGELIVGPVLISELIITRSAAMLTNATTREELISELTNCINQQQIFNNYLFKCDSENYTKPLLRYIKDEKSSKNSNLVNFMLNESYAKFFGVVFSNLISKCNLINPLVDINFLKLLLNSNYSFTNKKPFLKSPYSHFSSRKFYPRIINSIYPAVLKARMDRGYNLEDFLHWYKYPKPVLNYIRRNLLKKKKIFKLPATNYKESLKKIALDRLNTSIVLDIGVLDKENILRLLNDLGKNNTSYFQDQIILKLLTIHFFINKYSENLNFVD